ncbi:Sterol carrier family protein [Rhodovulum sp. P5]|uniref:SCP2 sterol-binding domain-containing protein n=1 Tax=Rhodovulum sp. P5 TaxID=1564506 RepID=UPI0009C34435|nr:SCP2 sterol-binding domain-containing protein [Rhodovulum sp. P5]ARE40065.1 Sterol carrier family protein [Rhodovulum sp. P5]
MSETIDKVVEIMGGKVGPGFDGIAKFVIEDEGAVIVDCDGVRAGDDEADVTLTATLDTFRDMLEGDLNPTAAFMTGKLKVDGDMGKAMALAQVFT